MITAGKKVNSRRIIFLFRDYLAEEAIRQVCPFQLKWKFVENTKEFFLPWRLKTSETWPVALQETESFAAHSEGEVYYTAIP